MTFRAKPFSGFMISRGSQARRLLFVVIGVLGLHSVACSGTVSTNTSTTSGTASSSSSGGAGGASGSGGMGEGGSSGGSGGMGTGGGPIDGGSGPVEYVAFNLFTHVPRFVIYKIDHTRNLCFRIMVEGFSGPGPFTIDVNDPWVASRAEVTNNVSDCVMSMGFPPQPMTFANATSGMGSIVVPGGFPCAIDVHATITFEPVGPWVPASESFDVDDLNVDGGCG